MQSCVQFGALNLYVYQGEGCQAMTSFELDYSIVESVDSVKVAFIFECFCDQQNSLLRPGINHNTVQQVTSTQLFSKIHVDKFMCKEVWVINA